MRSNVAKFSRPTAMGRASNMMKKSTIEEDYSLPDYPLASALRCNDMTALRTLLQATILPAGAQVENIILEQSVGESFTGGRSTPVYYVKCTVVRGTRRRLRDFVVKLVVMPGHDEKVLHKRESYAVERRFYESTAAVRMRQVDLIFPKLLYSDRNGSRPWPVACFCMNDLRKQYPMHPQCLNVSQAHAALQWLATMHATFWGESDGVWRRDVWKRGGFWTRATRVSSLQWMPTVRWLETKYPQHMSATTKGLGVRLERLAEPLTLFLAHQSLGSSCTLIHGDYKAANLFFVEREDEITVAVVDFQYTGAGMGAEDVAYLLYPDANGHFWEHESALLDTYHETLITQLMVQQKGGPSSLSRIALQQCYELARLDLTRYWLSKGWVASTEGEAILVTALESTMERIDGGNVLRSLEEYKASLQVFVKGARNAPI